MSADDGSLHVFLPVNQFWARSLLPGIARFIRAETPFFILNHSRDQLLEMMKTTQPRPAAFMSAIGSADHGLLKLLTERGIPAVNVSGRGLQQGIDSVVHDDWAIGVMAAEHLSQLGERHYFFMGLGDVEFAHKRYEGFRAKLKMLGVTAEVERFDGPTPEIDAWLKALPLPAAVFCAVDARARALALRAERLGIYVPDQLAILGVDNDPFECELTRIPLSSIHLRFEELGYRAAQRVYELYCGQEPLAQPVWLPPSHVEVRHSTDYLAVDDPVVSRAIRFIRQPHLEPISVSTVAVHLGISRRSLEKRFRKATADTVFAEIHTARMERARRLLTHTRLPVDTIAARIGLVDTRRFVRLFKQQFGSTPFVFRRKISLIPEAE